MRHRFLTVTVAVVLIGLVSGQFPFRNGFQSSNYASGGNGPQVPVNYGNLQNFAPYNQASYFSNSGSGIPLTNVQSNAAAGQASDAASASFFPQISNQPPNNNFQFANSYANPIDSQLSSADAVMSSLENNPLIKQFFPGPININPVTNGARLIKNSQNGFPIPYATGSNALPDVNPSYTVPASNVAGTSFFPQTNNRNTMNNLQYANSFANPVGSQLPSAGSIMNSLENNPFMKQFLRGSTNPVTNGAQFVQNSQNRAPNPLSNGLNPIPNVNPSDIVMSSLESNPLIKGFFNNPANQEQIINRAPSTLPNGNPSSAVLNSLENTPVIRQFLNDPANQQLVSNRAPNALPNASPSGDVLDILKNIPEIKQFLDNPANQQLVNNRSLNALQNANPSSTILNSLENIPVIRQFLNDPANQQLVNNRSPNALPNANPSDDVLDLLKKIPEIKQFLDNPANQLLVNNQAPNALQNSNSSVDSLDSQEKNPLVKQFLNNPINQRILRNRGPRPLNPRRRYRRPFPIHPNFLPKSNSWSSTDNYKTDVTENSPNGNKPTNSPTVSSFTFTEDSSNNPAPSGVPTFSTIVTDKPSLLSALNSTNSPNYSLPSDFPLEYPKSDFPEGFFADMIKSLGINSKSASTVAAIQPKRRRKCKVHRSRTGTDNSSKSTVNIPKANTGSTDTGFTTKSPSDILNSFTLSSIGTVSQVSDSMFSDSSQADTKLTTVYPSDILKQFALSNIKVKDSLATSKAPSTRKRKHRKRPKIKVTDLVSKTPDYSYLTSAVVTSPLMTTPQIASTKSITIIDTKNTNQISDLTTVGPSSVQPKKKKKCNKVQVKPKGERENSQNDLLKEQPDISKSFIAKNVKGIINLSNASNNDTNFRSSDKRQKSRKCQSKKERMKAANSKGLTAVSTAGPTDVMTPDNMKQDSAATDSSETNKDADKTVTIGSDSCGIDEIWWDCKPLNNTCTNVARGKSQKNSICESGCYCTYDLVKDVDGTCVDPDDCAAPNCKDEDHEEITDCLIECSRCEDDCHPCQMQGCVNGCDCKDGFKRNDNGTCVLDIHCPPCSTVISD